MKYCDFKGNTRYELKTHIESKHGDNECKKKPNESNSKTKVKSECNICDYLPTSKHDLYMHIKSKHDGLKCHQCDHTARTKALLKTHVEIIHGINTEIQPKHEENEYSCERCDFKSTFQNDLNQHFQIKHYDLFLNKILKGF